MSIYLPIKCKGQYVCAIIDAEDVGALDHNWHLDSYGYPIRHSLGEKPRRTILMHRHILGLVGVPKTEVDHINRNRLDNRRANLRLADRYTNTQNVGVRKDNRSGYRGVTKRPDGRFSAKINHKPTGGMQHLGSFATAEEAAAVAAAKRAEYGFAQGVTA